MENKYDLWSIIVKPAAVVLAIIIVVFITQAIFDFSDNLKWVFIGVLSLLWLIYYYVFEFRSSFPEKGEEMPDEV